MIFFIMESLKYWFGVVQKWRILLQFTVWSFEKGARDFLNNVILWVNWHGRICIDLSLRTKTIWIKDPNMIKIHLKKVGWRIEWSVSWLAKKNWDATGEHGFLLLTMAHIFEAKGREVRPLEVEGEQKSSWPMTDSSWEKNENLKLSKII